MSVIISNMELPESCAECPLLNTHTYVCTVKINADVKPHARAADCPLVSFDKPVGLTDAEKIICKVYLEDLDKTHSCNEYHLLMKLIDNASTVSIDWGTDGGDGTIYARPHGRWVLVHPLQENDEGAYMCSVCHTGDWCTGPEFKFCPYCGAKMDGGNAE